MSLCLTAGAATIALGWTAFTLAWTHTVEHVEWQEDWRVTVAGLQLVEARVQGTGAGMEPPPDARLDRGWWRYRPTLGLLSEVVLARAIGAGDWRLCRDGGCVDAGRLVGQNAETVTLRPCGPR